MKNIHILSTDKPSRLLKNNQYNTFWLSTEFLHREVKRGVEQLEYQNIYITNSEKPKEGDWVYDKILNSVFTFESGEANDDYIIKNIKKIILTTDQDLIKDGVQAIDDEFLEWFVKNPSCEEVEVKDSVWDGLSKWIPYYDVILPKEEPKQELQFIDDEVECNNCGNIMSLTENETIYACYNSECTNCYEEYEEEPKQETLEEAYKRIPKEIDYSEFNETSFNLGAKWQQERSYSEEKVIQLVSDWTDYRMSEDTRNKVTFKKWFEKFRK